MNCIRGRSTLEVIVVIVVLMMTVTLSVGIYAGRSKLHKSKALMSELQAMRTGIALYKKINGVNPPSLDVLTEEAYRSGGGLKYNYVLKLHRNAEGAAVDTFGHAYDYSSERGRVRSTTRGYEFW